MAARAGYGGIITAAGLTVGVKVWAFAEVCDPLETTTLADNRLRTNIGGLFGYSGALTANWDNSTTLGVGDAVQLTLRCGLNAARSYICHALITGKDTETAFDGLISANLTFTGSGALPSLSSSSSST